MGMTVVVRKLDGHVHQGNEKKCQKSREGWKRGGYHLH